MLNQRLRYAWYRYRGMPIATAKRLSHSTQMPAAWYSDLERWFFYSAGKLTPDPTNGQINYNVQVLGNFR